MKKFTNSFFRANNFTRTLLFVALFAFGMKGQNVLIPYTGSTSVPCGSNVVLQAHNGSSGTYNNNADGYCVLDAGFQAVINIAGGYTTEASFDYIRIYSGVGTSGPLLASYNGQNLTMNYTGTPGQTLTVRFQSDGSVVYAGFNLGVTYSGPCFSTPCTGVPASNTIVGNPISICPSNNSTLNLNTGYNVGGIQYQWVSSTTSAVGPFTPVSATATNNSLFTPTLGATTWFQAVITCTNSNLSFTTSAQQVFVQGVTTSTIPYYESFEGVTLPNRLPNCSWAASNVPNANQTYTSSASNNRIPRTGNNFAAFSNAATGTSYFYTNGIQMEPGITYSAGLWYASEYFGYSNWTNLSILVGAAQTPAGLSQVASVGPAISGPYKALGGTFTVPSSGLYYVAIRANGAAGSALYLSWDDLSVTIPCTPGSGNSPTVTMSANSQTICAGDQLVLTGFGADLLDWGGGVYGGSNVVTPTQSGTYSLVGTNTVTGCQDVQTLQIIVNPTPTVIVTSTKLDICPGETAYLSAIGASNFAWSNGANGAVINVSPTSATTYSAIGTNANGCSATGVFAIGVLTPPSVSALANTSNDICKGEMVTINASGANSYQWFSSTSPIIYQGSPLNLMLQSTTTFTVKGIGSNGCEGTTTISQNVQECVGISETGNKSAIIRMYPNPASTQVVFESQNDAIQRIVLTDMAGRILLDVSADANTVPVNISAMSNGIYFATVHTSTDVKVLRLSKN